MIKPTSDRAPSTWLLAACGSGAGRVGGRDDDAYLPQLRWPPLSGRGHQPRGLAVLPLPAQPAHGRGDAGRPRHHRQPQDHTAIGAQVRPELRQPSASAALRRRQMAPGRGCHQNCWQETLGVARGGPGGHRARHPGAEPARQMGRQTAPAQAAEAALPGAARDDHRQACQLWGCEKGDHARR